MLFCQKTKYYRNLCPFCQAFVKISTKVILLSESFQQMQACFSRVFNKSQPAFGEPTFGKLSESLLLENVRRACFWRTLGQPAFGEFSESFRRAFRELSESFQRAFGELSESFRRAFEELSESFREALNESQSAFRELSMKVSLLSEINEVNLNFFESTSIIT